MYSFEYNQCTVQTRCDACALKWRLGAIGDTWNRDRSEKDHYFDRVCVTNFPKENSNRPTLRQMSMRATWLRWRRAAVVACAPR